MRLEYDINVTNKKENNETYNLSFFNIPLGWFELPRKKGLKINRIYRLAIKFYAEQSQMTRRYYLQHRIPMSHRLFFRRIAQNRDFIYKHIVMIKTVIPKIYVVNGIFIIIPQY